jgi:transposase
MDFLGIIEDLKREISGLKQENAELRYENDRLRERLKLNSTNSSLPPSRDLYKVNRKNRLGSGRKPGGQPGHKPQGYQMKTPDEIINVFPDYCACGHQLEIGQAFSVEQKIEIPPIKPYITEYHLYQGVCRACGKKKTASLPTDIQPDLLGNHAKAIISTLSGFFHNSKRDVQQILQNVFNLPISLGLVSMSEKRVSQKLETSYENLVDQVEDSSYLHIDETGHKCRGKRGWAWIFTTRDVSLLRLTASRGKKVLHSILPAYEGWVISDRYGAYRYFEDEKRQVCWSHLDRDFQRFAHSRHPLLAYQGGILIRISQEVFALDKALKALKIDKLFFYRRIRKLKKRLLYVLKRILQIPDVPHAHRVAQNLMKSFEMMWRFVDNREIEPTNNLAERQIRKYVVYRKKSLFTWSDRGNEFVERILSLFLTCRLQKQNPFLNLSKLIAAPT